MEKIYYDNLELSVSFEKYLNNNRKAIILYDYNSDLPGEIYTKATLNLPYVNLNDDEVVIKNYSENVGLDDALIENNLTEDTGKTVEINYITVPIHKILKNNL